MNQILHLLLYYHCLNLRIQYHLLFHRLQYHYPYLHEQGDRLAREINEFCRSNNIPAQVMNAGSMMHLLFGEGTIESSRDIDHSHSKLEREFYLHLLGHDVIVPGIHLSFLSFAHKPEIVDEVIAAFKHTFEDLRQDGLI